jgi:hypothetical protein
MSEEEVKCPACSAPVALPATACPYCGAALSGDARSAPTLLASAPPPLPPRFSSSAEAMDEVKRLLRAGDKLQAVKVHREYFGLSLKESTDAVNAIESDLKFQAAPASSPSVEDEPPAFARPETPPVEPVRIPSVESGEPPAWRNWAIGCGVALLLFCCVCVALPLVLVALGLL